MYNKKRRENEKTLNYNYEFKGEYTDVDLITLYDFKNLVTKDMTLYTKGGKQDAKTGPIPDSDTEDR